ncbi:CdiA C-terminal domain-containing protein [Eggerthella lenta]|uniref:CdiA C-terminal domain-containing protein n=1 Tax=Eggerthella lenta TaxID=84112 RepID=UPI0018985360|nr:hypothetical protein [Eggerthella lenta]
MEVQVLSPAPSELRYPLRRVFCCPASLSARQEGKPREGGLRVDFGCNAVMVKKIGKIIVPGDANVWPHEQRTAQSLARAGFDVEFVKKSDEPYATSADALIDGKLWEMKSPTASSVKAVERNLKRARWQSGNIVFDSRRMKGVPDAAIERELRKHASELGGVAHVLFVNRHGAVIDIK